MGIRPEVTRETYDEVMELARKNSIIQFNDFESALIILTSLVRAKNGN